MSVFSSVNDIVVLPAPDRPVNHIVQPLNFPYRPKIALRSSLVTL